jgi:S1-C subfamily serine protease
MLLLALTTQTSAFAATSSYSVHTPSPRSAQPRVPGYLGIGFHDANGHGVEIIMVDHDGPAGKSGLRPHDLILSLNGQAINSSEVLSRMIHEAAPGTGVTLSVQRDGRAMVVKAQIADRGELERSVRARVAAADSVDADPPVNEFPGGNTVEPSLPAPAPQSKGFIGTVLRLAPFTGLGLQTMEPQLAEYFGDTQGIGLLVQMVMPNSPAAFSGLRAGDIVLRADTVAIKSSSDWNKRLRANQGQSMQLTVLRDKREIIISLTPELKHHSMLEWPKLF